MNADRHSLRAENLLRFREAMGLSRAEMAAKSGVLPTALREWEIGSCRIPMSVIDKIADGFGIASSMFLAALDCDGKPSMTADIFRHGIAWGRSSVSDQIKDIQELLAHDMPFDDNLRARLTELLNGDWSSATTGA